MSSAQRGEPVLVTGCSTGLGLETALFLAQHGLKVYATVRNLDHRPSVLEAAEQRGTSVEVLRLDVTEVDSIDAAIAAILAESGSIYGLVNNAGIALRGCVEDLTEDEIRNVFEANIIGTFAVTKRVLPHMRAAGRGRIITISSVGGRIATFGLSAYCATKFAQEGFAEALALEVRPFGLHSVLIEPGIIRTSRWAENRGLAANALRPTSPYYALFRRHEALADELVNRSRTQPVQVARAVHTALTARSPHMRYVVGRPAALVIVLRRYLPADLFERVYFDGLLRRLAGAGSAEAPAARDRADVELRQSRGGR